MILTIEGNIGAGKTTLLKSLQRKGYDVVFEPLERYCSFKSLVKPYAIHNPLACLYTNTKTDVAIAQLYFMKASYTSFEDAIQFFNSRVEPGTLCMERCFQSTIQFIELYNKQGYFTPFVYDYLSSVFEKSKYNMNMVGNIDAQIYLDVDPKLCYKRVRHRGRNGEIDGLTLETLEILDSVLEKEYLHKKQFPPESLINDKKLKVFRVKVTSEDSVNDVCDKILSLLKTEKLGFQEEKKSKQENKTQDDK